jgi:hypothetical protein
MPCNHSEDLKKLAVLRSAVSNCVLLSFRLKASYALPCISWSSKLKTTGELNAAEQSPVKPP